MACLPNNSRVFRCQNEIEYSTCLHLDCGQAELPKRVIGQRHHVSEACETRRETNGHHGHASSSLLFVPPPTLDFQIPFEGKTPCVASSVDLNPDAYKQTTRFILKREKKTFTMAGARGCFNCGGCAWCFRVDCRRFFVRFVFAVACLRVQTQQHIPYPLSFPPFFSLFLFFFLRGAVLTGTAFFLSYIAYISTRHNSKKKNICSNKNVRCVG